MKYKQIETRIMMHYDALFDYHKTKKRKRNKQTKQANKQKLITQKQWFFEKEFPRQTYLLLQKTWPYFGLFL